MGRSPVRAHVAPRYLTRFRCIGADCEDTCCAGWSIVIDARHHRALRSAMDRTPRDRQAFANGVRRIRGGRDDGKYALFVLQPPDGRCSFLADGLCDVHRRFGEAMLPDVCAVYPRHAQLAGDRIETTGSLSCPEMARQALLPSDAMALEAVETLESPRSRVIAAIPANETNPYRLSLDDVRLAMLQVLEHPSPLAGRLGTLVALAESLAGWFTRESTELDVARLAETLRTFAEPAKSAQMSRALASIGLPLEIPMRSLVRVLGARTQFASPQLPGLFKSALDAYTAGGTSAQEIARAYAERRDRLAPIVEPRLEPILSSYAMNHVLASWFTNAPDLGVWVRGLLLRVALVRFFVYAHPDVASLSHAATLADATPVTERVAVHVVSKLSRAFEHLPAFLALLDEELPAVMPGLEHALCLTKV